MNRRTFIWTTGAAMAAAGTGGYLVSDRKSFTRDDVREPVADPIPFQPGEKRILYLASLAPSGHNTQPWLVRYVEPYHWIVCNDKTKWLPAVDPTQRETMLSIGAFMQNLELAAADAGYSCAFDMLATSNQDEKVFSVRLARNAHVTGYDISRLEKRRTIRSGYLSRPIVPGDLSYIVGDSRDTIYYLPTGSREAEWLDAQTVEANRIQAYRDDAQRELAAWIRFSSADAERHCDGLTTAGMEITGLPGWVLRNFYGEKDVLTKKFRDQGIDKIREQVSDSAGWLIFVGRDGTVPGLLEAGRRFQRTFLKVRERKIALHPMTQILEEEPFASQVKEAIGIHQPIQFIVRAGYVPHYPDPVTVRRPVGWFVRSANA